MYLFRDTKYSRTLIEMSYSKARKALLATARSASRCGSDEPHDMWYTQVSATEAHRWVRNGGLHETALYTDIDGRIRRASNDESAEL